MNSRFRSVVGEVAALANQPAPVTLGPLTLSGPEAPSRITIGGAQMAAIHKLPGGGRVIDVMGPDDSAVVWQGVFLGPTAAGRARVIDAIRSEGQSCVLTFGDYIFEVIIVDFQYSYELHGAVISYRIRTEKTGVITPPLLISAEDSVASDLSFAMQSLTNTKASISAYNLLPSGPMSVFARLVSSMGPATASQQDPGVMSANCSASLSSCAAAFQNAIPLLSVGSLSGASTPFSVTSGNALLSVVQNAGALASAVRASGYVNRAAGSLSASTAKVIPLPIHS